MPYQITYVVGVTDPVERAACVGKILKTVCGIDTSWLQAHPEAPRLADAGIRIVPEPRDTDIWHSVEALLRMQQATEPEYACALAAERAVRDGRRLEVPPLKTIDDEQTRFTVATDLFDGDSERDLSNTVLSHMLVGLTELDAYCLKRHPEWPGIYDGQVRYEEEPIGQEDWADIPTQDQLGIADCFPEGTLLLRDDLTLQRIEDICVGDRIWGRDAWTTVEAVVEKGNLSVDVARLNNGSLVTLTGDHHFFVARCPEHGHWKMAKGVGYCNCPLTGRKIEKVRLRELQPNDVLTQPERLPFGTDDSVSPERTYVEGLYISDGWHQKSNGNANRFCISGQDGCPKEEQKREVERTCASLGLATRWHRKYIAINDRPWAERMALMGGHSTEKHALSLNLPEPQAKQLLRGIMADSKVNDSAGWTFTTTSRELMVQTRVLHKMFGRSASVMFITNHGGLGKNPIWRLGIREPKEKAGKLLRVKSVEQDVFEAPCYDIQTSDHYVYLPEHDVTVSNCEDLACRRAAELNVRYGIRAFPTFVYRRRPNGSYLYHILTARPDMAPNQGDLYRLTNAGWKLRTDTAVIPTEDPSRHLGMQ